MFLIVSSSRAVHQALNTQAVLVLWDQFIVGFVLFMGFVDSKKNRISPAFSFKLYSLAGENCQSPRETNNSCSQCITASSNVKVTLCAFLETWKSHSFALTHQSFALSTHTNTPLLNTAISGPWIVTNIALDVCFLIYYRKYRNCYIKSKHMVQVEKKSG